MGCGEYLDRLWVDFEGVAESNCCWGGPRMCELLEQLGKCWCLLRCRIPGETSFGVKNNNSILRCLLMSRWRCRVGRGEGGSGEMNLRLGSTEFIASGEH